MRICGMFPPREDIGGSFSDFISETTCCIRKEGHLDEHLFRKPDGTYISWKDDWECNCEDCMSEDPCDWCVVWWEIDEGVANILLAKEKPME